MKSPLISTDAFGTGFAILVSHVLPPWLGYPVARFISRIVSIFPNGAAYQALRMNQWTARGKNLSERELRQAVHTVFANQGRALYDFYHSLDRPGEISRLVSLTPKFEALVEDLKKGNKATILLIPHLSGFNLGGLRLVQEGLRYLTLSYPNPSRGYVWQNNLRNQRGMEVLPMTVSALRNARERLQAGGVVLTGIDRPLNETPYHPRFFGYPSNLPVSYIRLALKMKARLFVVGFLTLPDHTHLIDVSNEIILENDPDPVKELECNAEKVLQQAEVFIRQDLAQWMMFYPVWPNQVIDVNN